MPGPPRPVEADARILISLANSLSLLLNFKFVLKCNFVLFHRFYFLACASQVQTEV